MLSKALARVGPLELPDRSAVDFPLYLARAVVGQQLSVKAAASIWRRVEAVCDGLDRAESFHESRTDVLRGCGLSAAKVKTLTAIAQFEADNGLCTERLRQMSAQARAAHLTQIWGVGQWTADMANIFWFAERDIWPEGDVTARKTLERLTSKRRKTVRSAARFAPYRSYLTFSLWQIADAPPD